MGDTPGRVDKSLIPTVLFATDGGIGSFVVTAMTANFDTTRTREEWLRERGGVRDLAHPVLAVAHLRPIAQKAVEVALERAWVDDVRGTGKCWWLTRRVHLEGWQCRTHR